jgi:hypothetical protein
MRTTAEIAYRASGAFQRLSRQHAAFPVDFAFVCLWTAFGFGMTALALTLGLGVGFGQALAMADRGKINALSLDRLPSADCAERFWPVSQKTMNRSHISGHVASNAPRSF